MIPPWCALGVLVTMCGACNEIDQDIMQKYRKQIIIGLIIALAIYIFLLIFLDSGKQFDEDVLDAITGFPIWLMLVLCLTQVSAGVFRFLEWHYYLGVIDARDKISLKDSAIIFVASFTSVIISGTTFAKVLAF